mgnify:CR=1 FL=1
MSGPGSGAPAFDGQRGAGKASSGRAGAAAPEPGAGWLWRGVRWRGPQRGRERAADRAAGRLGIGFQRVQRRRRLATP